MTGKTKKQLAAAASIVMAAAAVYLLLTGFDRDDAISGSSTWICLAEDEIRDFEVPHAELARLVAAKKPVICPHCNSNEVAAATPCPHCGRAVAVGPHGVTAETCQSCGGRMPDSNVDLYHSHLGH